MNELKPEDVMRALELCKSCRDLQPCDVCPYFRAELGDDESCVNRMAQDALDLLREYENEMKIAYDVAGGADAIIEGLKLERNRYKAESDQYQSAMLKAQAVCVEMGKLNQVEIAKARADAINEFAEKLKTFYNRLPGKTVGGSVEYHIDQIAKEMKGGEQ